jgi:hypothetical protein
MATLACGAHPAPAAPPAKPEATAPPDPSPPSRSGVVELSSLPGAVTLDDPGRWRAAAGGAFSTLEHPPSRSTLALRVWRAARNVRPAECEADARTVRPDLPRVAPESMVDSRRIQAPDEFMGTLVVGVEPTPDGSTRGFALAVSSAVGRCFLLSFETVADGADAALVVADRLREAVDRILPSVELHGVEERVRPEREP